MKFSLLWISAALCFASCDYKTNPIANLTTGNGIVSPISIEVTWEQDVQPIFKQKCFGCHANGATRFNDYETVRNIFSNKILPAIKSGRMPMGGSKLSSGTIKMLEQWEKNGFVQVASQSTSVEPTTEPTIEPTPEPIPEEFDAQQVIQNQCVGCHASGMTGVPNIYSLPVDYLVKEMKYYKSGERQDNVMFTMNSVLTDFSETQLQQIAEVLNEQDKCSISIANNTIAGDIKKGAMLFKFKCASCHTGAGTFAFPWLKGQDSSYLVNTMKSFVADENARPSSQMKAYLRGLKEQDFQDLAAFIRSESDCQ